MRRPLPIFYNALLLTVVNLVLRFVSTTFQVHISSRIGAEGIGLLQLVLSVGGLALTAGMAGIRTATMYLTAEELGRKKPQNVTWVLRGCFLYSICISGGIALAVHWNAPYLASNWVGNPRTADAIALFAKFLPLVCLTGCMTGYFTAASRITTLAGIEIAEQLCYIAVTMTLLTLWAGSDPERACEAVVAGSGISSILSLACLCYLRYREHPPKGPRIPVARRLAQTAVPLGLADDVKSAISTTEHLMVPKRLALYGGELTPLATFGTVVGMVFPVLMFPAAILFALAELLIPELARCNAAGSNLRIRYLVKRGLRVALLYGCMSCGILYLIAGPLCMKLYDSPFAGEYLAMYSLLIPMLYCDIITDAMTKGLGQQKACVRYNILTSAMDVILLFLLLPTYGMQGYFISFFVTHLLNFILSLRRLLKISQVKASFYRPALTCSAVALGVMAGRLLSAPLLRIPVFLIVTACVLVLFGVVGRRDFLWVKGLVCKK